MGLTLKLAIQRANQDYVVPASTSQDALPSPLALLAATCSKIGAPSEEGGGGNQQSGVSTPVRVVGNGNFNGSGEGIVTGGSAPAWVQLPAGGGLTVEGVKASTGNASSAIQTSGGQILQQPQLIAQTGPGGTVTYSVVPPSFQTLSIDGQEAIFIPSNASGNQSFLGNQAIISSANGQFVRAAAPTPTTPNLLSNVAGFGNLGSMVNIGGNWINLASLQNAQRPGMIQTLQLPLQQQVQQFPNIIQIPISNGQGGHTLQTIQLPVQSLGANAYQTGQFQGAIALPTGATISAAQLGANGQAQTQMAQQFVSGTQPQQMQIQQQQNTASQIKNEGNDQSAVVVMSTGSESSKTDSMSNANSQSNTQVSAVNQVIVTPQQSDSPAPSQPQQTSSQSQAITTFANQSQPVPTLMPFMNMSSPQALFTGTQGANTNGQNVLSFAIASVPQAGTTTTTTTASNATTQQMAAQNIISPQLLQSLGAQGFGNFQLTSNGQIIATQNPAFMQGLNVANVRQAGPAGMQAVQIQNMQGLQGLTLPALQNLQNFQAVQTLGGGAQLIGGGALQNFGVTLANAGNSAQLPQLSPQQIQMQAMGTQQAALQQTQQALNQAVLNATTLSGQQVTTIQDPNDPTKWQIVQTPSSQTTASSFSPSQVTVNQSMGSETGTPTGRRLRREACTCPNCRDSDGRTGDNKKKQHICHMPNCNKVYGKTSHLRAHLRWHTGERPFVCGWLFCGKRFTRSDELQRHTRTHTGDKKFQCTECVKKFMRSDHLSKHRKTHQIKKTDPLEASGSAEEDDSLNDSSLTMDQDGEMPDDVTIMTNPS